MCFKHASQMIFSIYTLMKSEYFIRRHSAIVMHKMCVFFGYDATTYQDVPMNTQFSCTLWSLECWWGPIWDAIGDGWKFVECWNNSGCAMKKSTNLSTFCFVRIRVNSWALFCYYILFAHNVYFLNVRLC